MPAAHAEISPDELSTGVVRRFLHITLEDTVLSVLMEEIVSRFAKLYPEEDLLSILGLQDRAQCDLDPDFTVADVFDSGDVIRVLSARDVHKHRISYSEEGATLNGVETPAPQLKTNNSVVHSTPLSSQAPVLTDVTEVPQDDVDDEYFHTANHRLPTKKPSSKANTSSSGPNGVKIKKVHGAKPKPKPSPKENMDIAIVNTPSIPAEHDDSNVSLPPPEDDTQQSRIIPKKRVAKPSFDLSGTSTTPVAGKRVTSGMLNVPLHTQIHSEIIQGSSPKSVTQQKVIISSEDLFDDDTSYEGLKVEQESYEEDQSSDEISRSTKVATSKIEGETMDKQEVLNLFKLEGRNLQRLKRNLQIDMVDPPVFDGTRAPRAAAKKASSMLKDTHKPQAQNHTSGVKVETTEPQKDASGNGIMPMSMTKDNSSVSKENATSQSTSLASSISLVNLKPGRPRKQADPKLARIEQAVQTSNSETSKALFNVLDGYSKLEADPENFKPIEINNDGREFVPAILLHASPNIMNLGPTEVSTNKRKRRTKNKASNIQPVRPTPVLNSKNSKISDESSSSDSDRSESSGSDSDDEAETHLNKKPRLVISHPNRLDHTSIKPKTVTPVANKTRNLASVEKTPAPDKNKLHVEKKIDSKLQTPSSNVNGSSSIKPLTTMATPSLLNSIKKPTLASLTSLQDLLKKGTPDVHDVNSPNPSNVVKKVVSVNLNSDDLDSGSDATSDNESSYSSSSDDELAESAKFITTKKVGLKTPRLKNRLSSLFSRK